MPCWKSFDWLCLFHGVSQQKTPVVFWRKNRKTLREWAAVPENSQHESKIELPPELDLVVLCVRARSFEGDARIRQLFTAGINWSEMLACAVQHKVVPAVYERFRALDAGLLAREQRETLAEFARTAGKNNLVFLSELLQLSSLFAGAEIPAIPFKGPSLAWLAYPNFAQRSCVDLDFVVPQSYIPAVLDLLQSHGFIPQFSSTEVEAGQKGVAPGQYAFVSAAKHCSVEIHTERTLRYFSRPLNLEELDSRLIHLDIGGHDLVTFSVEDLLVMLCVHGAKHFWERLAWIVDIAQLVTVRQVDWKLLSEIAAERKCSRLLLLGLYLAYEVVGAPLPESVLQRARSDSRVAWLAGKVIEQLAAGTSDAGVGVWPRAMFRFRSSDSYWNGLQQLFRLTVTPTESDRERVRLPGGLSYLYSIVRPVRLLSRYGWSGRSNAELAGYLPMPLDTVDQMLRFAEISPRDVLYDLGCGDGRIVVAAAKKCGIRAVGVDIDPSLIEQARANARRHGVETRTEFILGDARTVDLSAATVVTMYLGAEGNLRLADRLREQLRPGARIVSLDFQIYGWLPDRVENRILKNGLSSSLFLWTIQNQEREPEQAQCAPPGAAAAG